MRTYLLSKLIVATTLVVVGQSALAADIPVKSPVYVPAAAPAPSWTGFYFGVHAGAGWGDIESSLNFGPLSFPLASHGIGGYLAGAQVGYNWQQGKLVFGLEGNASWAGIDGSAPCLFVFTCRTDIKWLGDVSARFGVTAGDALLYVKGGLAWANANYSGTLIFFPLSASGSKTSMGFLLGTGAEYRFALRWSAKIEYNYIDFGNENVPLTITAPFPVPPIPLAAGIDQKIHAIKFGVNYHL